jgi:hypothetical protein
MAKRCPPGVICIENITITIMLVIFLIVLYLFFNNNNNNNNNNSNETRREVDRDTSNTHITREIIVNDAYGGLYPRANYSYSNIPNDIFLNPYTPPYRDDRIFPFNIDPRGTVPIPINISTSAVDTTYRQVGILKRVNGQEMLLPLMGRPLFTNRDKWQFYTLNENNIKLPVTFKQKSCTSEYGCDNIYTGDSVYVDGIDAVFKATVYDNAVLKYLPFV